MTEKRALDVLRNPNFWLTVVVLTLALFLLSSFSWAQTCHHWPTIRSYNPHVFFVPTGGPTISSTPIFRPAYSKPSRAWEGLELHPFRYITYKESLEEKANPFLGAIREMKWREEQRAKGEKEALQQQLQPPDEAGGEGKD